MTSVNELHPRVKKLMYDLQQQLREVFENFVSFQTHHGIQFCFGMCALTGGSTPHVSSRLTIGTWCIANSGNYISYIYRSSIVNKQTTTVVIPKVNKQFPWKKVSQLEALAEREVNRKDEWKAKIKDIRYHIKYA